MIHRRRRIVFYFETRPQHEIVRSLIGREVEIIAASDSATAEAALRLYQQVDTVLVERHHKDGASLRILESAKAQRPTAKRVMLANSEAIAGVYEAVYERVIDSLMFLPCSEDKIRDALGLASAPEVQVIAGGIGRAAAPRSALRA